MNRFFVTLAAVCLWTQVLADEGAPEGGKGTLSVRV
jgi:hypothetical protein